MAQENRQNYYFDPAGVPVRRKRGRPRKDDISAVESSSRYQRMNRGNTHSSGSQALLGQQVSGILDGTFDAGYLLSVQVGTTGLVFKGMVFDPRLASPICAENDIAPNLPMLTRNNIDPPTTDASRAAAVPIANQISQQTVRAYHPIPRNRPATTPAQSVQQNDRELQSVQKNESAAVHTLNQVVHQNTTAVQPVNSDQPVQQNVRVKPIQRNVPAAVPYSPQSTGKNVIAAQPLLRNEPVAVDLSVQKAQQNIGLVQPLQKIEPVAVPPPAHLQQNFKVVQPLQTERPVSVLPPAQPGQQNYEVVQPLQIKEPVAVLPPALHDVQQNCRVVESIKITEPDANPPPVQNVQQNCGQPFEIVGHDAAPRQVQTLQEFRAVQPFESNEPVNVPTEIQSVQQNAAAVHHPESSGPATVRAIQPLPSKEQVVLSQGCQPSWLVQKALQFDSKSTDTTTKDVTPSVVKENVPVEAQVAGHQPGEGVQVTNLDAELPNANKSRKPGINSSISELPDSSAPEIPQAEVQNAPAATKEAPPAVVTKDDVSATIQVAGHQPGEVIKAENLDADQQQEPSGNFSWTSNSDMILNVHSSVVPTASTAPEPPQAEVHTAHAATKEVSPADVPVTIQVVGHQPRGVEEWNPNADQEQELSASSAPEFPEAEVHNVHASTVEVLSAVKEVDVPVTVQDDGLQPGKGVQALNLDADQRQESPGCATNPEKETSSLCGM